MKKITMKLMIVLMSVVLISSGSINVLASAAVASDTATNDNQKTTTENSQNVTTTTNQTRDQSTKVTKSTKSTSGVVPTMANLTLDMDPTTPVADKSITYNMTSDGVGWPSSKENAKQLLVGASVTSGDTIEVKLPTGIDVTSYDTAEAEGATVNKKTDSTGTTLTYTFSQPAVLSFNISYIFVPLAANTQYAPGITTLPVTVTSGASTLEGYINGNNPITSDYTASQHNTGTNSTFAADGKSVYNFVLGIKTTPSITSSSHSITQAEHTHVTGVIHVPDGFVLSGASIGNWQDTTANVPADGSNIPGIPDALSQPGGAGSDIVVTDAANGSGYGGFDTSYWYLYGYFATGTTPGTYHFSQDLQATPNYYDGSQGNFDVKNGSFADVTIYDANPGSMATKYSGVLGNNNYNGNNIDPDHEGFYSKSISNETGLTGFVSGKEAITDINTLSATPILAVEFNDDTVNQTNSLRDYVITTPKNWCGDITDIHIQTAQKGTINGGTNENDNGPFEVSLDNGSKFTVLSLNVEDPNVTAALNSGAHITKISGHADILPGNNLQVQFRNAVIEDGTYQQGDLVPMQLDVHSETSNTDITAIGHLKYFDDKVMTTTQFSIKGDLDYNITGTYTQGATFTTGAKWTLLNQESVKNTNDNTDKILIPGSQVTNATATLKLPTLIVSSVDNGQIDLDQNKIGDWGWSTKDINGDPIKYKPVITDLGADPSTGEHLTKLDFSEYTVTIPANTNPAGAFFYPDALPWKVNDIAPAATGTTSHWITQITDNNKDDLHPVYGGGVYEGSVGQKWTITASTGISSKSGLAGNKTGISNFYTFPTGEAGFDRGIKSDTSDDNNSGLIRLAISNATKGPYDNAQTVVTLPSKDKVNKFDMELTGPVNQINGGGTALYSTKSYDMPAADSGDQIDLTTNDWLSETQVTDWSTIKSVALKADSISAGDVLSGYVPVRVANIADTTIADTASFNSYAFAKGSIEGNDLSSNIIMTAKVWGTPQIKVHYEETKDNKTSDGTVLDTEETITGDNTDGTTPAFGKYQAVKKAAKSGYTYVGLATNSAAETGTLNDATTDVTYLYKQDPQKVKIHYINVAGSSKTSGFTPADGQELTKAMQTVTGLTNDKYTNTLAVPKGYKLVEQDPEATAGTFDDNDAVDQDAYVYVDELDQKLVYNVIDQTTGTKLESNVLFDHGGTNTKINKTQADLDAIATTYDKAYDVVSIDKMPTTFDDDVDVDQVVNIVLKKANQKLHVHYINITGSTKTSGFIPSDGKEFTDAEQLVEGDSGAAYTNKLVYPKGYELVEKDPEATAGVFDQDKTVDQDAYVYVKGSNQRVVYNVINDSTGSKIESDRLFDEGPSDTKLNKTQNDLQQIANTYKDKYTLVSVDKIPTTFDNDVTQDQVVNIHVKNHATVTKHTKTTTHKKALPQTGENNSATMLMIVLGLIIISLAISLGYFMKRSKRNKGRNKY